MDDLSELVRVAESTDSCLTVQQIRDCGYSKKQIAVLVRRGLLRRVFVGVYVVAVTTLSHRQVIRCALLAGGPSAHVAARTALEVRGAATHHRGGRFWIGIVGGQRRPIRRTKILFESTGRVAIIHFVRVSTAVKTELVAGFPVPTVGRSLVDTAAREPASMLRRIVREADYLQLLDEEDFGETFDRRRHGTTALRRALPRGPLTKALQGGPDSRAAYRLIRAVIERGFVPTSIDRPMRIDDLECRPDAFYAKYGLILEADGPQHRRPERAAADQRRDLAAAKNGLETLRIDTDRIRTHLAESVDQVVAALLRRALE